MPPLPPEPMVMVVATTFSSILPPATTSTSQALWSLNTSKSEPLSSWSEWPPSSSCTML